MLHKQHGGGGASSGDGAVKTTDKQTGATINGKGECVSKQKKTKKKVVFDTVVFQIYFIDYS